MTPQAIQSLYASLMKGPGIGITLDVAVLAFIPMVFVLLTSFTRIVVVLSFVRTAVGVPTAPPNLVIVGLSLLLTLFTMQPVLGHLNAAALTPLVAGKVNIVQALVRAAPVARHFLASGTSQKTLGILMHAQGLASPKAVASVPFLTLALAFALSQLTLAFEMALIVYIPFLILDLVVSSILVSLGMMMLPPTVVSLPLKLLLFVAVGGWGLVAGSLLHMGHL